MQTSPQSTTQVASKAKLSLRQKMDAFAFGVLSAFDMSGEVYSHFLEQNGPVSDVDTLRNDWEDVGKDLQQAMNQWKDEQGKY